MRTAAILSLFAFIVADVIFFGAMLSAAGTITAVNFSLFVLSITGVVSLWSAIMYVGDSLQASDEYFRARREAAERSPRD